MIDLEAEYNNSRRVPAFGAIAARWQAESAAFRAQMPERLDLAYGPGPRERYDLFGSGPLVTYLHGGYWQEGDRTLYGWVGRALVDAGCSVAIPSYSLCPDVTVLDIVEQIRRFLAALRAHLGRRPLAVGHSAGGHLAAAMLATGQVRAAVAISGVFDLGPLVATSINGALRLDAAAARAASPRLWPPPPRGSEFVAAVGAQESNEFRRQSRELADDWSRGGVRTRYLEVAGANHFTVVEQLAVAGSPLQRAIVAAAARA